MNGWDKGPKGWMSLGDESEEAARGVSDPNCVINHKTTTNAIARNMESRVKLKVKITLCHEEISFSR